MKEKPMRLTRATHEQAVTRAYAQGVEAGKREGAVLGRTEFNEQRARSLVQLVSVVSQTLGEQAKIVDALARVLDNYAGVQK